MKTRYDVVALGELLIDFTSNGNSEQGNPLFEANPGGAPCNMLAMLSKLGRKTAFLGKVGDDLFGRMLRAAIEGAGIDSYGLVDDPEANTTLAFVQTAPDGDRDFSFFRNPGADTRLTPGELALDALRSTRIFHFGSLSLTDEPARSATVRAVAEAKAAGALISFDPNLREPLWRSLDEAREQMLWGAAQCDILKVAEEELAFLTGLDDLEAGQAALRARFPQVRILFVTRGKQGAHAYCGEFRAQRAAFTELHTIDTTGAGDTFCGCCLAKLLEYGIGGLTEGQLDDMLLFANAAASLVTTKRGAIRAMPTEAEILALMDTARRA